MSPGGLSFLAPGASFDSPTWLRLRRLSMSLGGPTVAVKELAQARPVHFRRQLLEVHRLSAWLQMPAHLAGGSPLARHASLARQEALRAKSITIHPYSEHCPFTACLARLASLKTSKHIKTYKNERSVTAERQALGDRSGSQDLPMASKASHFRPSPGLLASFGPFRSCGHVKRRLQPTSPRRRDHPKATRAFSATQSRKRKACT